MKTIKVSFSVVAPETDKEPTAEEIEQWIKYCVGALGGISCKNPLAHYDMEAIGGSVDIEHF